MKTSIKYLIVSAAIFLPATLFAQAMTVIGGNDKAQECYLNANIAAELPSVSKHMLEPCDYALEFADLKLADRAATLANRGILLAATGDIEAAMKDYESAMSLRPGTAEIFVNRGNAFFLSKNYSMALQDYERSVELDVRQLHYVHYNMGMAYEKLGNDQAAEREFRSALEIQPGWALAENRLALLLQRRARENAEN